MKNFSNLRFFGKNLNRFVVLTLAFTFIGALFVFFSACKKDAIPAINLSDISEGQFKKFNWDAKESKFFELHRDNGISSRDTTSPRGFYHPLLVESYNKLADENEKGTFAGRLTDVAGFPRWENALIYRDKNTNTNFVSIPLAFPGKNQVSSYISLLKQGDGEFVINGITRPDLLKTNQGDPRVKDSRARILAGFDKNLFGTVQQDVKDAVCYYGTRRDSIENNLAGGSTVPPTPPLQFCRYIPVYICIEDNKLKWGSYTGLLPIHLDHDMDGTPNQDDPQWIQAVVASGLSNQAFQDIFENFARDNWEQEYEGDYGDYDDFYEQLYDPNGGQDLSDLADMLVGIGQSIADAFDNFFHDIGHEIGDGWHDFWRWFGHIFDDGPPCPWDWNLTSVTDREVTCGTIYLLACGGEEGTQEWWDKMIEQMEGYTPPEGYSDLRDYTAQYIADNNLEGLIEYWELVDILDGTNVNTACYPSNFGGFSDCADDKMLQFVTGTLDFYNVMQLEQDQVYLLENNRELLAVITSFVHDNFVGKQQLLFLVDDIIRVYQQLDLTPEQVKLICEGNNWSPEKIIHAGTMLIDNDFASRYVNAGSPAIGSNEWADLFNFSLEDGGWDDLNPAEKEWVKAHPYEAYLVKSNRDWSRARQTALYGHDLNVKWLGKGDSFLHTYWNALNTVSIGETLAKEVGDNHEYYKYPEVQLEWEMDFFNNHIGRSIGAAHLDGTRNVLEFHVLEAMENGQCVYLKPVDHALSPAYDPNNPSCTTCRNGILPNTVTKFTNE